VANAQKAASKSKARAVIDESKVDAGKIVACIGRLQCDFIALFEALDDSRIGLDQMPQTQFSHQWVSHADKM
jgi:hypothetical protein